MFGCKIKVETLLIFLDNISFLHVLQVLVTEYVYSNFFSLLQDVILLSVRDAY